MKIKVEDGSIIIVFGVILIITSAIFQIYFFPTIIGVPVAISLFGLILIYFGVKDIRICLRKKAKEKCDSENLPSIPAEI